MRDFPHTPAPPGSGGAGETICAPATPIGGALCIVRISGPQAHLIVGNITTGTGTLRQVHDDEGNVIDQAVVSLSHAPHSYTGEDTAELSLHGSPYIVRRTLELLCQHGCRMAGRGELTRRAFLNGKMDLSAAEAVADLIASDNAATHRMAIGQLRGSVSRALNELRQQLLHLTTMLELELDFSDHEDLTFAPREDIDRLAADIGQHISQLIDTYALGRALKEGVAVAIVGEPNVGKSTLLNRLAGHERAIVSPYAGTTRDTIEEIIPIHGVKFRFIDTAGLRDSNDPIEQLGLQRTRDAIATAPIVLHLTDCAEAPATAPQPGQQLLRVRNKIDLLNDKPTPLTPPDGGKTHADDTAPTCHPPKKTGELWSISAKTGEGIPELLEAIYAAANLPDVAANQPIINNARHLDALRQARTALIETRQALVGGLPPELLSEHLRTAIHALGLITGDTISAEDTLANIFRNFCIGK